MTADSILARCDALAAHTEEPGRLTRTFLTPAHRAAVEMVRGWMEAAGMTTRMDGMANLIGHYGGATPVRRLCSSAVIWTQCVTPGDMTACWAC